MAAKPQLDLALRKNRGASIRRDWIARLKEACAYEILPEHFLALEEIETLKKEFFESVKGDKRVQHRQWPVSSLEELANALMDLSIDEKRVFPIKYCLRVTVSVEKTPRTGFVDRP